jgi:hypothetical protein
MKSISNLYLNTDDDILFSSSSCLLEPGFFKKYSMKRKDLKFIEKVEKNALKYNQ